MSPERKAQILAKATEWLLQQGITAVLLFCVLGYIAYALERVVPRHIDRQNEGRLKEIEKLTESSERQLNRISDSFDRDQERDETRYRDLMIRSLGFAPAN